MILWDENSLHLPHHCDEWWSMKKRHRPSVTSITTASLVEIKFHAMIKRGSQFKKPRPLLSTMHTPERDNRIKTSSGRFIFAQHGRVLLSELRHSMMPPGCHLWNWKAIRCSARNLLLRGLVLGTWLDQFYRNWIPQLN